LIEKSDEAVGGSEKLYFKTLVKLSVSSLSRFTGESQSQLVGDAVRGQKTNNNKGFKIM
jgi:hypothetical protein